jgi:hypothetical protein
MTRIAISDLKDKNVVTFLEDKKDTLIIAAVNRALDTRKVAGGYSICLIGGNIGGSL